MFSEVSKKLGDRRHSLFVYHRFIVKLRLILLLILWFVKVRLRLVMVRVS